MIAKGSTYRLHPWARHRRNRKRWKRRRVSAILGARPFGVGSFRRVAGAGVRVGPIVIVDFAGDSGCIPDYPRRPFGSGQLLSPMRLPGRRRGSFLIALN